MSSEVPVVFARWEQVTAWLLDRTEKFPKRATFMQIYAPSVGQRKTSTTAADPTR